MAFCAERVCFDFGCSKGKRERFNEMLDQFIAEYKANTVERCRAISYSSEIEKDR